MAEHADIWHGFYCAKQPDQFAHENQVLDDWCVEVGRDPSTIERSAGVNPTKIEAMNRLVAGGVQQATLGFSGPRYDLGVFTDWLARRNELNAV